MADKKDSASISEELGPMDVLMHRAEANPRTRSGMIGLEILDTAPNWERARAAFEYASRKVIRLRQKVVMPALPTTAPRWVVDPDFNLDFHVRRVRIPEPGTLWQVFDFAEVTSQSPMDIARPLWSVTFIEGLQDGRAAVLSHMSHAVTDGVGSVEMFADIYDLERDPPPRQPVIAPSPQDLSAAELALSGLSRLPANVVGVALAAGLSAARLATRVARNPAAEVGSVLGYLSSTARMMASVAEPSPLLRRRSLTSRTEAIDIDLQDLRAAAKAAGGSVNDAYLAGLCGALNRYHQTKGMPVATLPLAVPVNLRADTDAVGGNHFTGVRLAAPIGVHDVTSRISDIRAQMIRRREESALNVVGLAAPLVAALPTSVLDSVAAATVPHDVQASNVPVYQGDTYFAGAKILRQYGIGPLPGVAMMAMLLSRGGVCTVTTRYDRASVTDDALWANCLLDGFNEVLALGGNGRARPASFAAGDTARGTQHGSAS